MLSCSHFERPEFSGPGDYATPGEYMNSAEVQSSHDSQRPVIRGPFQLRWPVANPIINRGFKVGGKRDHLGLDLKGRRNDEIFAAHDGYVVYAGNKFKGYGKMIILEYDGGWATLYAHLNKHKVKTGQEVKAGELIGLMGRTGRASGVHLHFELLKNKEPIDPLPLLDRNGQIVKME
jgi:murein DD-endopeptidase MepM/ murein hydrolase activator NlpD